MRKIQVEVRTSYLDGTFECEVPTDGTDGADEVLATWIANRPPIEDDMLTEGEDEEYEITDVRYFSSQTLVVASCHGHQDEVYFLYSTHSPC